MSQFILSAKLFSDSNPKPSNLLEAFYNPHGGNSTNFIDSLNSKRAHLYSETYPSAKKKTMYDRGGTDKTLRIKMAKIVSNSEADNIIQQIPYRVS
ncbi:hypothetical protein CWI37_0111p0050 [Hamiltosporidium tvaerminnensis]|uniref:Uncharacterized protein n=1 Tax=Hamiltosporidium tvaerminnensis TaxID=1176355 RepID=A0A4Q9LC31_9MICR|nr:hypothetical protein CWI37_0111p0050 [Hamiltosporidium tvaerminnensis]